MSDFQTIDVKGAFTARAGVTFPDATVQVTAATTALLIAYLLSGGSIGDLFYIDKDIDGNLTFSKLAIGPANTVLLSNGKRPYWDTAPASGTFYQACFLASGKTLGIIAMNDFIDKTAAIASAEDNSSTPQDGSLALTKATNIITMNDSANKTAAIATAYTSSVV